MAPRHGFAAALLTAGALAGCTTQTLPTRYATETHALKAVRQGDEGYFTEYGASHAHDTDPAKALAYVDAGMTLAHATCMEWLNALMTSSQRQEYAKKQLGVLSVLATGVLGIAGAGSDTFTGLAAGTAFTYGSMDLYRDYALLGEDSQAITDMVDRSMAAAMAAVHENPPKTFHAAFRSLASFSRLCEPAVVRQHVIEAIRNAEPEVVSPGGPDEAKTIEVMSRIAKIFDQTMITDQQLIGLYWYTLVGSQKTEESRNEVAKRYLGQLADRFVPSGGQTVTADAVKPALLDLPDATKANIRLAITAEEARRAEGSDTKTQGAADLTPLTTRLPRGGLSTGGFSVRMR